MRVLVATDQIGALSSGQAGQAIATGWASAQTDSQLAVVSLGESGSGFTRAVAEQLGAEVELVSEPGGTALMSQVVGSDVAVVAAEPLEPVPPRGLDPAATSAPVGYAVAEVLRSRRPHRLYLDLGGLHCHDAGAGLLGALGATADRPLDEGYAGLAGITRLDLTAVRELVADTELIAVVSSDQVGQHLLGLRGITSLRGREVDADPADMLAADATLERLAALADPQASALPGAGAAGGAAYAIAALGGRITTGPAAAAQLVGLTATMNVAELVVTGSSAFDFGSRGGGVVQYVAQMAQHATRPCIALAGTVVIGSREMRTMGVEAAYPVRSGDPADVLSDHPRGLDVTAEQLTHLAARIAGSWQW
jgi:glycerate kinase